MIYFLKKMGFYTGALIFMLLLFILYPIWIENIIFDFLSIQLKGTCQLLYPIMEYIPLTYISLIGLIISAFNTSFYCFIDTDMQERWLNNVLGYISIAVFVIIAILIVITFLSVKTQISSLGSDSTDEVITNVQNIYYYFSSWVTYLTFGTFAFFLIIDLKDCILSNKRIKKGSKLFEKKTQIIERKYSKLQIFLIDVPVLFSSSAIVLYNKCMDESMFRLNMSSGHLFLNVFDAGAWGVQIVYSQIVFYVLMCSYYSEAKPLLLRKCRHSEQNPKTLKKLYNNEERT